MHQPPNSHTPQKWATLSESLHANCKVFDVYKKHCEHPIKKKPKDFFCIKSRDWAHCLPLTPNKELILIQQYRFGIDDLCWEVPGGIVDKDEDPLTTATRELTEETGYKGENTEIIGTCRPNPAILNNTSHFVLIENCILSKIPHWDENEEILIQPTPVKEVYKMVAQGIIDHGVTLNALFFLQLHLNR